jgi:cytochrome c553
MKLGVTAIIGLITLTACGAWCGAASVDSSRTEFFEKKIRPILMDNCYKCHSPAGGKLKGGLNLSSREGLLKGGENGAAILPGHPEKSRLIEAVRWGNKDLQMPPKTQLPQSAIADLEKWVQLGAPWVGGNLRGAVGPTLANYDKLRQTHWAWQPLHAPQAPSVKDTSWPLCDVDRFVLANLEQNGLHPVGQANQYELLRRVTFDLTGLPPTVQEIEAFVADSSPDAYAKVVERLLASPAFGERWGRHWLDVARYAESTGSSRNYPYEYAWRYRDYVIDSFNADKPYNQFVLEQIAGDQLPWRSAGQHDEQLVATGFLALGVKDLNEKDRLKYTMDNVDEQIDVVGKSMLGLTVSCARCHDHKFDPIPQSDYYRLAGIFKSTDILCGLTSRKGGNNRNVENDALLVRLDSLRGPGATPADMASTQKQLKELQDRLDNARAEVRAQVGRTGKNADAFAGDKQRARKRQLQLNGARQEIQNLEMQIQVLMQGSGLAIGVRDERQPSNSPLFEHGETEAPGPIIPRGTIGLCKFVSFQPVPANQSGRLELARWIASRENPLTTRVVANRIWHYLFGQGIVRTVDNFGTTGEAPSNPELLDYLANRFVRNGWSFKRTIRELVLSRTYQLAGTWDAADGAIDPGDRFVWRSAPRRLEAEEIRDAILLDSGTLDTMRPVGSPVMAAGGAELRRFNAQGAARAEFATYRSVYLPVIRDLLPSSLEHFDFANPEMVTGDREVTTVAPQALYLMNDPFVLDHARQMARRVLEPAGLDEPSRIDLAYRIAFGRPASSDDRRRAGDYLYSFTSDGDAGRAGSPRQVAWASLCQALIASAEFRYVN